MSWLPEVLYLVATSVIGVLAGGRWLTPEGDIGAWWSLSHRIATGARLYRDVYPGQYGPLSPYLLAWMERIFGVSAGEFLLVNWLSGVLAGGVLLMLSRRVLTTFERCGLAGVIIATSVLAPGPGRLVYSYAPGSTHALVLALLALMFVGRKPAPTVRDAALAGLLAGLAFGCKQEIGVAAAVALWAPLVIPGSGGLAGARLRWVSATATGFAVGVLPAAAIAFSAAPLDSLRADSRVWPLVFRPGGDWETAYRRIAGLTVSNWPGMVRSAAWTVLAVLVVVAAAVAIAKKEKGVLWARLAFVSGVLVVWRLADPARLGADAHPIVLSSVAAALVLAGALAGRIENRVLVVSVSAFALLVSLRTVVSAEAGDHYAGVAHLATALTWAILVCRMAPGAFAGPGPLSPAIRIAFGALFLIVGWTGVISAGMALGTTANEPYASPRGTLFVKNAGFFSRLGKALRPEDRVLALPEPYGLEPIFGVRPWSKRLLYLPPAMKETESRLLLELERDPPEAVVVVDRPTPEYGVDAFGRGYGRATSEWLARRCGVERFPGGAIGRCGTPR